MDSIRDSEEFKEIYNLSSALENAFMEKWHSVYSMTNVKGKEELERDKLIENYKDLLRTELNELGFEGHSIKINILPE